MDIVNGGAEIFEEFPKSGFHAGGEIHPARFGRFKDLLVERTFKRRKFYFKRRFGYFPACITQTNLLPDLTTGLENLGQDLNIVKVHKRLRPKNCQSGA